jgi:homoserine dehydrogenase
MKSDKRPLVIGLFGFGCIGQGLYHVLHETTGIQGRIKRIAVKHKDKPRTIGAENFTFDANDILNDPEIDVLVELIDNADEAFQIVKTALSNGKAVVSANKKMIATHFDELFALQQKHQVPLLYEGSACGSIPIIRTLEEYYDNDLLSRLEGIVNGTTNYILSRMADEGVDFDTVLRQAQESGFAESDPSLDIDGYDAVYKLAILIGHTFGVFANPDSLLHLGIRPVQQADIQLLLSKGHKLQLLGHTSKVNSEEFVGYVMPTVISNRHPLYNVSQEYNGVLVEAAFAEKQVYIGKGAGSVPTAAAVLSDISALTYNYRYGYKRIGQTKPLKLSQDIAIDVLVRVPLQNGLLDKLAIQDLQAPFEWLDHHYFTGKVKIADLLPLRDQLNQSDVLIAALPEGPGIFSQE